MSRAFFKSEVLLMHLSKVPSLLENYLEFLNDQNANKEKVVVLMLYGEHHPPISESTTFQPGAS